MQIMPSSGGWVNPAAQVQQALGDSKHASVIRGPSTDGEPVNPLEESGKAGDRDANERYDGPQSNGQQSNEEQSNPSSNASENEPSDYLSLPAEDDDSDGSTLDLLM